MLDRRSIPVKLGLAVGIPVVAALLFAILALRTVEEVRIGGTQYTDVAEGNNLTADILPPPFFIVESFLLAQLMADVTDNAAYQDLRNRLEQLQQDYEAAQERWLDRLDPADPVEADLRRLLTEDAFRSASDFYTVVEAELYPAVEDSLRSGDTARVDAVLEDMLLPLYEQHRASIVEAVPVVEARVTGLETDATENAQRRFTILIVALVGLMLGALLLAALVVRAIVGPIVRLARAADDVAQALSNADLDEEAPQLEPIELNSSRELNTAASSFNTLIGTTAGLLDRHARMRRNLSDIFQNLGRRNHGLLTRSLHVITELEQSETDPETLDRLFRLDHLATRIRRNAENLLVLAGSQSARPVERQASITDIIRSALSEIEAYTRVDRPELQQVAVRAGAVADVTHLLAELIENATIFSPPECRVRVIGAFVDEGYAVTVVDEGLGMRDDAIEEANQRIQRLTSLDLTPTRTLGLYVVGRLAQRHGIRVRLLEGSLRGMVAKVILPMSILADPATLDRGFDDDNAFSEGALDPAFASGGPGHAERVLEGVGSRPPSAFDAAYPLAEWRVERITQVAPPTRPAPPALAEETAEHLVHRGPGERGAVEERSGMRRRVRGAQMPETRLSGLGPPDEGLSEGDRGEHLEQHRNSLRDFQRAVQQGTQDGRATAGEDDR
jgi:signal transduction histidine kinase